MGGGGRKGARLSRRRCRVRRGGRAGFAAQPRPHPSRWFSQRKLKGCCGGTQNRHTSRNRRRGRARARRPGGGGREGLSPGAGRALSAAAWGQRIASNLPRSPGLARFTGAKDDLALQDHSLHRRLAAAPPPSLRPAPPRPLQQPPHSSPCRLLRRSERGGRCRGGGRARRPAARPGDAERAQCSHPAAVAASSGPQPEAPHLSRCRPPLPLPCRAFAGSAVRAGE